MTSFWRPPRSPGKENVRLKPLVDWLGGKKSLQQLQAQKMSPVTYKYLACPKVRLRKTETWNLISLTYLQRNLSLARRKVMMNALLTSSSQNCLKTQRDHKARLKLMRPLQLLQSTSWEVDYLLVQKQTWATQDLSQNFQVNYFCLKESY